MSSELELSKIQKQKAKVGVNGDGDGAFAAGHGVRRSRYKARPAASARWLAPFWPTTSKTRLWHWSKMNGVENGKLPNYKLVKEVA